MIKVMKRIALLLIVMVFARSCILEERSGCPAYLGIDFSKTPPEVENIILMLRYDDGYTIMDTISSLEFMIPYEIPVKRGALYLSAYGNVEEMVLEDGVLIANGKDADCLYTCFRKSIYNDDLCRDTVLMEKSNIGLYVRVLSVPDSTYEVKLTVESGSIGYNYAGEIITGKFKHEPIPYHFPTVDENYYEFLSRILRQQFISDVKLTLKTVSKAEEEILLEIPLASKLKEAGMGLPDSDLRDLYITIDYARMSMWISISDWDNAGHIEIEI